MRLGCQICFCDCRGWPAYRGTGLSDTGVEEKEPVCPRAQLSLGWTVTAPSPGEGHLQAQPQRQILWSKSWGWPVCQVG